MVLVLNLYLEQKLVAGDCVASKQKVFLRAEPPPLCPLICLTCVSCRAEHTVDL